MSNFVIRYETGLEQLDFAAGQVAVMQQNLRDLQPLLVETSDKTEKLMIKIEQDTVVVEKQKEVRLSATPFFFLFSFPGEMQRYVVTMLHMRWEHYLMYIPIPNHRARLSLICFRPEVRSSG